MCRQWGELSMARCGGHRLARDWDTLHLLVNRKWDLEHIGRICCRV